MNFAVIGSPIEHTLSPMIHNANFRALGLDDTYRALHVTPGDLKSIRDIAEQHELDGFNVTIPHKETIMEHLDDIDPRALEVNAVNTVMVRDGRLTGFNTDVTGYKQAYIERFGDTPRNVLILGGGGASKAVYRAHREIGDDITIYARRPASFETFQDRNFTEISTFDSLGHFDVIINTTPVGLKNEDLFDIMKFPKSAVTEETIGVDLIYNPYKTPFLEAFQDEKAMNGLAMLVNQGLHAFEIWHDDKYKGNYKAVYEELNKKFGGEMN
ncbi:shikimate dehydrogenase [Salinicoccus halitifaciens]|uniref:Shikimate dehydrogenase (NADP(+)) n=1 Tax=Salinicoccus halitifaciens TaxID=1073415 RepID=A0ABV2E6S8_9STAP|nr:shikimate dehydrogenase [Salinicoccus halitifaciens]MCD2136826.1 shikimate dehydrogenase [Salinicoccus halitifaciens]